MAASNITLERLRELLSYDQDTGIFTFRVRTGAKSASSIAGCRRHDGYLIIRIDTVLYLAHRLAWLYVTGEWPIHEIDHIDGDKSNCRFNNLRDVTHSVNNQNSRNARKNNITGLLGVSFVKPTGKFRSSINLPNQKSIRLGYFNTAKEAHEAYIEAKRRLHSGCTI